MIPIGDHWGIEEAESFDLDNRHDRGIGDWSINHALKRTFVNPGYLFEVESKSRAQKPRTTQLESWPAYRVAKPSDFNAVLATHPRLPSAAINEDHIARSEQLVHEQEQIASWLRLASGSLDRDRMKLDISYILTRLERLFSRRQAVIWMSSYNNRLGTRPIDAIALEGAAAVIRAVDSEEEASY
jgi:hypothetical protein